tara:strand:- start:273 stop:1490 length:1218 start_codon:yes stop_codon:yes gene_type:complete
MELADNPNIHTVTQLNNRVKSYVEKKFNDLYVAGEIASFQEYPSGHTYFSLKDKTSEISCVLFKNQNSKKIKISIGMQLILFGNASLYSSKGKYQFIVKSFYQSGTGYLYNNLEKLKKKLFDEGLFLDKYKKDIPRYPSNIGVITSLKGAVINDIITVFSKKAPNIKLIIRDTSIQGFKSVDDIINAIKDFNSFNNTDTILLCRGGGNMEDLQPFNDENVVRAIFKSKIPIITGIGHEGDYTLSDLVSDFRASTPTSAAEKSIYNLNDLIQHLDVINKKINFSIKNKIKLMKSNISLVKNRRGFLNFDYKIKYYKELLKQYKKELSIYSKNKINFYNNQLKFLSSSVYNLNPNNIIEKGYAILQTSNNEIINKGEEILIGQNINIKMKNYNFKSLIINKVKNEKK